MNVRLKNGLIFLLETAFIVTVTLIAVLPVSCKLTETGIHIMDGDYDFPKLESFCVEDEHNLKLTFSESVQLVSQVVSSENNSSLESVISYDESKQIVNVELVDEMEIGLSYELLGTVKDDFGNSLTFALPFLGYNNQIPKIIITEIQTESVSSRNKMEKELDTYRNEYVEFLALSDGNLCGLELCSAYDGEERRFIFPNVKVSKGEIFVVHLRNRGNGCISETEDNLSSAFSSYTSSEIRDLWTEDTQTALGNKTDVIVLRNSANKEILDCFIYKEDKVTSWTDSFTSYLKQIEESSLCDNIDVENSFNAESKTSSTTITRNDGASIRMKCLNNNPIDYPIPFDKENWSIQKASPGTL